MMLGRGWFWNQKPQVEDSVSPLTRHVTDLQLWEEKGNTTCLYAGGRGHKTPG